MTNNTTILTDQQAPDVQSNYTSPPYVLPTIISWFETLNTHRPKNSVSFQGDNLMQYVLGLIIFPVVVLIVFLVWLVFLIILNCLKHRFFRPDRGVLCFSYDRLFLWKRGLKVFLFMLLFATLICWIVALAFSIQVRLTDQSLIYQLNNVINSGYLIWDYVNNLKSSALDLGQSIDQTDQACVGSSTPNAVSQFNDQITEIINTIAQSYITNILDTSKYYLDLVQYYLTIAEYVLYVREAVMIALACFQVILGILLIVLFSFKKNVPTRCCCTLEFTIFIWQCVFACLFAAGLHSIALIESDLCYPNVNDNVIRLANEFLGSSFSNTRPNCTNPDLVENYPIPMQLVCYYQTCHTDSIPITTNSTNEVQDITSSALEVLKGLSIAGGQQCTTVVTGGIRTVEHILGIVKWILYILSCPHVNGLYTVILFEQLCSIEVYNQINLYNSWFAGMLLLLVFETFYLFFGHVIFASAEGADDDRLLENDHKSIPVGEPIVEQPQGEDTETDTLPPSSETVEQQQVARI